MKTAKLKIMTILGTRPEIIRLSCIIPKMDEYFDHILVYTKQNYDYGLSEVFFKEFELRKPDHLLEVKGASLGEQIANIIEQTEKVILEEKPDALLVLGDTNSALSTINAKRLHIPIFHMEAGNRSFDWEVPEEVNRRIVDHISDYNLPYTEHSRRYLLREGIDPKNIFVTGSPLREVFSFFQNKIEGSNILNKLNIKPQKYFLVSTHREENVENKERLREIFSSLNYLAENYKIPIIVSLHPRTKKRIGEEKIKFNKKIRVLPPFGYFDYSSLQKNALCTLSDSGTIQEESAILDFPAVQIRVSTERPEAFDAGSIILCGFNKDSIINSVKLAIESSKKENRIPQDYFDSNVSIKVVKLIMGIVGIGKYNGRRF